MKNTFRHIGPVQALVVVLFLAAGSVLAQAPMPPPDELDRLEHEIEIRLEESVRQAADEYLEALEQFEDLLNDYSGYFSKIDDATLRAYDISFDQFAKGIERGTYSENPRYLAEDIDEFTAHLSEQEAKLKVTEGDHAKKLYRLFRNLRRDLTVIRDLVTEDIAAKIERHQDLAQKIQEYVQKVLRLEQVKIANLEDAREQYEEALKEAADQMRELDELPEPPLVIIETPSPPKPPSGIIMPGRQKDGEVGLVRTFSGNINVGSQRTPIYISQPYGSVSVIGWKNDQITAELRVEVAAGSHDAEKKFMGATKLQISSERNGYYVESMYPELTDPQTRILHSVLVVNVPAGNTVTCDNAFGTVKVSDLHAGVTVKGNYSTVVIQDITGSVRAENANGRVAVSGIKGRVNLLNSAGAIEVTDCQATIEAENSNGPIILSDNRGRIMAINSGPVEISDHRGPVEVENKDGVVRVFDISGDVRVFGSGQAVVVEDIQGAVSLENSNAVITAISISGALRIENRNGDIHAEDVNGPLNLIGQNGNIRVVLEQQLQGTSHINSRSGGIILAIPEDSDMLVSATTDGGEIRSVFDMDLKGDSQYRSATIKLGSGQSRLTLKGTKSSIRIEESQ